MPSTAQELLESWWNVDPEMLYLEVLCGHNLRVCVRLFKITLDSDVPDGWVKVGEAEAWTLEDAIRAAVAMANGAGN